MQQVVATPEENMQSLEELVSMLNDMSDPRHGQTKTRYSPDDAIMLRRWVLAWKKMLEQNAGVVDIRRMDLSRDDRARLEAYTKDIQNQFMPDGSLIIIDEYTPKRGLDMACLLFTRLLRNPKSDLLGGPCLGRLEIDPARKERPACGQWYIKKTNRESKFCSRRCAVNSAKVEERKRLHGSRIESVSKAITNYLTRPRRFKNLEWKEYVVQALPGISKRFLTEAVMRGELLAPTGEQYAARKN